MSTGAECHFDEVEPGRWTYWLQDHPYGYTEEGQTYGPFRSHLEAREHLHRNHANPGGSMNRPLKEGHVHEWHHGIGYGPVGMVLTVEVESLGPDASRADVLALVRSLPDDHPALRVTQKTGPIDGVMRCDGCGQQR